MYFYFILIMIQRVNSTPQTVGIAPKNTPRELFANAICKVNSFSHNKSNGATEFIAVLNQLLFIRIFLLIFK